MNLLLDTHVLLWWLNGHPALSRRSQAAIADGKNLVFVSSVSVWEIRIKAALGKLTIPSHYSQTPSRSLRLRGEIPILENVW